MLIQLQDFIVNNKIYIPSDCSIGDNCRININDDYIESFTLVVDRKSILRNLSISIAGHNATLKIGAYSNIRGSIFIRHHNSTVSIGNYTTTVNCSFFALEGKSINIGDDCMFSSNVILRTSDEHSIIDLSKNSRINPAEDINIGNHVWIGEGVTINKGVILPDDVIVGSAAVLTRNEYKSHSIYAGIPARQIRDNVSWNRKLLK